MSVLNQQIIIAMQHTGITEDRIATYTTTVPSDCVNISDISRFWIDQLTRINSAFSNAYMSIGLYLKELTNPHLWLSCFLTDVLPLIRENIILPPTTREIRYG